MRLRFAGEALAGQLSRAFDHLVDDDSAKPFFKLCADLDVPVVIHPPPVGYGEEAMNDYRLASSVGRPQDNCLALARLIVRGIFEQFPTLKLVVTHLGGSICEVIGRMNYAYTLQEEAFFLGSYEPMLIKHEPLHYLKMCYLDTVCYHLPAARCIVETVGADRVIFGTDAPPLTVIPNVAEPLAAVVSVAVTVTVELPLADGVPEIRPVVALMDRPGGSPVAE